MTLNIKLLFLLSLIPFAVHPKQHTGALAITRTLFQYDTSAAKLKKFRVFSNTFFSAVQRNDTGFLKKHVIFPISGSSFDIFDDGLSGKKIGSRLFFQKLPILFPNDRIKGAEQRGEYSVMTNKNRTKSYAIEVTNNVGGLDSNCTWFFIEKDGNFYFTNFKCEAG